MLPNSRFLFYFFLCGKTLYWPNDVLIQRRVSHSVFIWWNGNPVMMYSINIYRHRKIIGSVLQTYKQEFAEQGYWKWFMRKMQSNFFCIYTFLVYCVFSLVRCSRTFFLHISLTFNHSGFSTTLVYVVARRTSKGCARYKCLYMQHT